MGDAELARLARQMGVPVEDADTMYTQAIADARHDPARALARYVELLREFRGVGSTRRPGFPGKRALTSRLSASGARSRDNIGRGWPGQHALTSRLAAPAPAQYALRSAEPTASPEDQVHAPLDQALRYSRGAPLATYLRRLLEGMFWQRFDDVLIHVDNSATTAATSINARAFTIANRIFFREDAYRPDTRSGLELIAHELTHVIQWRQGRVPQVSDASRISSPGDALEQEAAATAHDVTRAAATQDVPRTATQPSAHVTAPPRPSRTHLPQPPGWRCATDPIRMRALMSSRRAAPPSTRSASLRGTVHRRYGCARR
jgi:hypothetical protein